MIFVLTLEGTYSHLQKRYVLEVKTRHMKMSNIYMHHTKYLFILMFYALQMS
jgi:hypothetical protein